MQTITTITPKGSVEKSINSRGHRVLENGKMVEGKTRNRKITAKSKQRRRAYLYFTLPQGPPYNPLYLYIYIYRYPTPVFNCPRGATFSSIFFSSLFTKTINQLDTPNTPRQTNKCKSIFKCEIIRKPEIKVVGGGGKKKKKTTPEVHALKIAKKPKNQVEKGRKKNANGCGKSQ